MNSTTALTSAASNLASVTVSPSFSTTTSSSTDNLNASIATSSPEPSVTDEPKTSALTSKFLSTTSSTTIKEPSTSATPSIDWCVNTTTGNGVTNVAFVGEIFCDNGWVVFQRRFDGSVDFQLNWNNYSNGFGDFSGELWLDKVNQLTQSKECRLRVDLVDLNDNFYFADYKIYFLLHSTFSVDDETNLFRLHVTGYSGNASDALVAHDNKAFSTADRDNDPHPGNYATAQGPFWFGSGYLAALNGEWVPDRAMYWAGVEFAKEATMKFRCD
ncbi:unnamed protein product [Clavelina lepadiformis]|uniref:Fibrinogen C-terminal domain-containing protein n=1 Tax=Clavelina lepadiformis TaxID=159417 RepID=A0ABP0GIR9_CLALP